MDKTLKILLGVLLAVIVIFMLAFAIMNGNSHKEFAEADKQEAIMRNVVDSILVANDAALALRIDSLEVNDKKLADKNAKQDKELVALRAKAKKLAADQFRLAQINQIFLDSLFKVNSGNQKVAKKSKKGNGDPMTLEEALKKLERDLKRGIEGKK